MENVAKALDVVQGENHAYVGCALPTLAITLRRLIETEMKHLRLCESLVYAMLEGMERFRNVFKDLDRQLATAFHHSVIYYTMFPPYAPLDLAGTARRHPGL